MPHRRFLVIHNVKAGTRRRGLLLAVLRELEREGCIVTTQVANNVEHDRVLAEEGAASGAYDAIVAAGGDSTVRGASRSACSAPASLSAFSLSAPAMSWSPRLA